MMKKILKKSIKIIFRSTFIFMLVGAMAYGPHTISFNLEFPQAEAGSHKFMAFWDGGTPPTGWVCVSCTGGDDFFQLFPRGAATAGGTGGATTHTHTQSLVSHTGPSTTQFLRDETTERSHIDHTHGDSLDANTGTGTNLPTYRDLKVIRYDTAGDPPDIPDGVIVMFDADPGSGWTRYTDQDSNFIRGENSATGTGGSATHTHSIDGSLGAASLGTGRVGSHAAVATADHSHLISAVEDFGSTHTPLYRDVLFYKNTSGVAKSIDGGEIFMVTGAPGTGWTSISGSGGDFENRFLRGASAYGGTGGTSSHTPANKVVTSEGPSATLFNHAALASVDLALSGHTHDATISFGASSTGNLPPYRDTIIAKKDASDVAPTVTTDAASSVGVSSATLNGTVTDDGGDPASTVGFAYGTDSTLATVIATTTETGTFATDATFNEFIQTLQAGITYYFRAYAINGTGTGIASSILNFTTGTDTTATRKMRLFEGFTVILVSERLIIHKR